MAKPDKCNVDLESKNGKSRYTATSSMPKLNVIPSQNQSDNEGSPIIQASDSFRDSVGIIDKAGKRLWVYPQKPKGDLHTKRTIFAYFLIAVLIVVPFIKIGGEQLFMFNILQRKFVVMGLVFWPQDFHIFALGFLSLVIFVLTFTAIFGRLWCGWACPQTIFMESVFRKIEYWIEGNSNAQRNLAARPWDAKKIRIKLSKWSIFYVISFGVGNLLLSYIIGIDELSKLVTQPISANPGLFGAVMAFSLVFYFVFAWFREQACTFVCPYGRLQSVLLDKNSLVVAYDYKRGEPREKFSKKREESAGDCIECKKCVQACPTGIDIRNGTQLECVNCTACIDACNEVMVKIDKPKGLIRYASQNQIENNEKFKFTPRLLAYSILLMLLLSTFIVLVATRSSLDTKILRAKGSIYTMTSPTMVSNLFTLKVINKTSEQINAEIDLSKYNANVKIIGKDKIEIAPNAMFESAMLVEIPMDLLPNSINPIEILIVSNGEVISKEKVNFSAPPITQRGRK